MVLDVLAIGDVGGAACKVGRNRPQGAQGFRAQQGSIAAHAHHEIAVVQLFFTQLGSGTTVEAGCSLGVEAHPPEATAQVCGVDRVKSQVGIATQDAGLHIERVVILLGLLVLVERLTMTQGPLTFALLRAGSSSAHRSSWGDGHFNPLICWP